MADDLLRFVVTFPDGAVTLLPKRAPLGNSARIRGRTLGVLALAGASRDIVVAGLPGGTEAFEASILPGERQAIAVLDLAEADAVSLGCTLNLDEILFWDGRRGRLVACR